MTNEQAIAWRDEKVAELRADAQIMREAGEPVHAAEMEDAARDLEILTGPDLLSHIDLGEGFVAKMTSGVA